EKAADAYQRALAIRPSAQLWEELGITQAVDLKDLPAALKSFEQAVKTAAPKEAALAHLYRGEALHRMNRDGSADFRESDENWLALWRLGDANKAVNARDTRLPAGFFPPKAELYQAVLAELTDPRKAFPIMEGANNIPSEPAPLAAVQTRLSPGALLVEHAAGAVLWATNDHAGVGQPDLNGVT